MAGMGGQCAWPILDGDKRYKELLEDDTHGQPVP